MRYLSGDLVKLRYCDIRENQEIIGKPVRVVTQRTDSSPYWIDVAVDGKVYGCRGGDCTKLSSVVVGLDEVGRGAFAGPLVVVAAAFRIDSAWDPAVPCPVKNVKDSKKYTKRHIREEVAAALTVCTDMVAAGCGQVEPGEINQHGMVWAMTQAITRALAGVTSKVTPDLVLLDGNEKAHGWFGKQMSLPKADSLWWPVSAASVLAKVYRDQLMLNMNLKYSGYGFGTNSGYGTPDHIAALRKLGPCDIHRTQFIRSSLE